MSILYKCENFLYLLQNDHGIQDDKKKSKKEGPTIFDLQEGWDSRNERVPTFPTSRAIIMS